MNLPGCFCLPGFVLKNLGENALCNAPIFNPIVECFMALFLPLRFRTIMAAPCDYVEGTVPVVPHFSNPYVKYDGRRTGSARMNNARAIRAIMVSGRRDARYETQQK